MLGLIPKRKAKQINNYRGSYMQAEVGAGSRNGQAKERRICRSIHLSLPFRILLMRYRKMLWKRGVWL